METMTIINFVESIHIKNDNVSWLAERTAIGAFNGIASNKTINKNIIKEAMKEETNVDN